MTDSKTVKVPPQDGPKEKLLCKCCEDRLHKYETYYANLVRRGIPEIIRIRENIVSIPDFKYKSVRLILLSILWRLSITSIPNFHIDLSSENQEILRNAILHDNPIEPDDFPIDTFLLHLNGESSKGLVISPYEEKEFLDVVIGGILYRFSKVRFDINRNIKIPINKTQWLAKLKDMRNVKWLVNVSKKVKDL